MTSNQVSYVLFFFKKNTCWVFQTEEGVIGKTYIAVNNREIVIFCEAELISLHQNH